MGTINERMNKLVKLGILVAIISYYGFCPAPADSPSPWVTGVLITVIRFVFALSGQMYNVGRGDLGLALNRMLPASTPVIDSATEQIVQLDNFAIHIFTPKSYAGNHGAIVNFHGGGWVVGNVPGNRLYFSNMAHEAETVVVAPEYRLAPEHPYPAAIDDCLATVKYVFDHSQELNINPTKIVVTGDSAGGHLALVTALGLVGTEYKIKGLMPLYPVTQAASLQTRSNFAADKYLLSRQHMAWFFSQWLTGSPALADQWLNKNVFKETVRRSPATKLAFALDNQEVPEEEEFETTEEFQLMITRIMDYRVSPLFAPMEMLLELPQTIIYVCGNDVLKDDGVMMVKQMEDVGHTDVKLVEFSGAVHGIISASKQTLGSEIVPKATQWVSKYIKRIRVFTD